METFDVDPQDVDRAIRDSGLFPSLSAATLDALRRSFDGVRLMTGETLIVEGTEAHELYIVRHGRLRTTVGGPDGTETTVGEIGKNEVVGEMAVITDQQRSATVRALRDTDLFRLPAEAFGRVLQQHPEMLRPFATVVVNRLRTAMTHTARPALPATIVLVPAGDDDLVEFAHALANEFHSLRTVVLTASDVVGRTNPVAWLLEIENQTEITLLVADREPTDWTRLCLRHADSINLVADDRVDPGPTPVESDEACRRRLQDVPIHLLMRYDVAPRTSEWLIGRTTASHVNMRRSDPTELRRLARLITGDATILVLGGGGARGFAHFGVARALDEAGVPVDGIIGTSAGAVVGGMLTVCPDPRDAQRQVVDWFRTARWRRDFNPPTVALMSGRTITAGLRHFGGDSVIENLPIEFAAVSCDLVEAAPMVHDRGPLWQAVRASASVPGLFPPLAIDGRLLVDGGLVANLPTSVARERHPHARVIAVEVGDPTDLDLGRLDGSGIVNGWERLRQRGGAAGGASLARVMMRLTELGRHDATELADIVIRPDVRGFGLLESRRAGEIIERGYAAGRAAIEAHHLA